MSLLAKITPRQRVFAALALFASPVVSGLLLVSGHGTDNIQQLFLLYGLATIVAWGIALALLWHIKVPVTKDEDKKTYSQLLREQGMGQSRRGPNGRLLPVADNAGQVTDATPQNRAERRAFARMERRQKVRNSAVRS